MHLESRSFTKGQNISSRAYVILTFVNGREELIVFFLELDFICLLPASQEKSFQCKVEHVYFHQKKPKCYDSRSLFHM